MSRIYQPMTVRSILREQQRQQRIQGTASVLARSGLSVPEEGVTQVDGNLVVVGDFTAQGKVNNDALTDPVVGNVARASATNFSLSTAWAEKAGVDLTVPEGCTQLLATVTGRLYAINPRTSGGADGTGTDALYVSVVLGAYSSTATPTGISGSGGFATSNCAEAFTLNGLTPGSTVRLGVQASSGYQSLAADVDNFVSLAATLLWIR